MLRGFRRIGQSWVGKAVVSLLFGLLIISFAVWGIGDIFRGGPRNTVARVGETEITVEQFRTAFQNELQQLSRQFRRTITPDQARALGLDQQVLTRLVSEASLNQRARELGLSVSDELVARTILEDPTFRSPNGQFNRVLFEDVLRANNLSEAGFIREQRSALTRSHLVEALAGALPVPVAAQDAVHRYTSERRSAKTLVLPASAVGDIAAPTEEQLQAFYAERRASFRAPEYRSLIALPLSIEALAKPETVSDQDARQRYEQARTSRFGTPERRSVQQIVFPSPQEAEAALARIREGVPFETLAAERNLAPQDFDLGTVTRADIIDPAVGEAAFALPEGQVSAPVQGQFGTVLVRVTKVEPASVRPFEEVADEIKREIALERARTEIETVHDAIEDQRASARPLAEIARERGLPLLTIPAVDRSGRDKAGQSVELPQRETLLPAAFASDVGVDNEALRTSGGYVWFDVAGIEPAREQTLDEVREEATRQWREEEIARLLADRARVLVERLNKGETIEALAAELGLQPQTVTDITRGAGKDGLSAEVVGRLFAVPVGQAGSAAGGSDSRVIFRVTDATVPPLVTTTQEAQRMADQLRAALENDIVAQYIAQVQNDLAVTVNQQALRQAVGGEI